VGGRRIKAIKGKIEKKEKMGECGGLFDLSQAH